MSDDVGYIKLWRQLRQHRFWTKPHRFSDAEAWLDLLMAANFHDSKVRLGARWLDVRRGQVLSSQTTLARMWRWDRGAVAAFLKALKADNMADSETRSGIDGGYTLITIQNYERFQGHGPDEPRTETRTGSRTGSRNEPATNPQVLRRLKKTKEGKKGKKVRADARWPSPPASLSRNGQPRRSRIHVDADWPGRS